MAEQKITLRMKFRNALLQISKQLSESDVEQMKFLVAGLPDKPGHADVETAKSAMAFLMLLVKNEDISETNYYLLGYLLNEIGHKSLIKRFKKLMADGGDGASSHKVDDGVPHFAVRHVSVEESQDGKRILHSIPKLGDASSHEDKSKIAVTLLDNIINPNQSPNHNKIKLSMLEDKFVEKYGSLLKFRHLGVGKLKTFIQKSIWFTVEEDSDGEWYVQQIPHSLKHRFSQDSGLSSSRVHTSTFSDDDSDLLEKLLKRPRSKCLKFVLESEYADKRKFTHDIVSMWNTANRENSYIVVMVAAHDLVDVKEVKHDRYYQSLFLEESFSYKPPYKYSEILFEGNRYGVITIPSSKGFMNGDPCYAEKNDPEGLWHQENICYCSSKTLKNTIASRKATKQIIEWFVDISTEDSRSFSKNSTNMSVSSSDSSSEEATAAQNREQKFQAVKTWLARQHGSSVADKHTGPVLAAKTSEDYVDHVPAEILARGEDSLTAYKKALQSGKKAIYRTRLMFVGQERVGKTSLRKRLIGKRFDPRESITDGIDSSNSCHVSVDQVRNWNVDLSQDDVHVQALAECIAKDLRTVDTTMETSQRILPNQRIHEATYDAAKTETVTNPSVRKDDVRVQALAECMAKDLRTVDTTVETSQPTLPNQRMREVTHSAAKTEMVTNPSVRKETAREEIMPPEVQKALLEELQKETEADVKGELELSLWDFAGQELYYVTHQVFLSKRSVVLMVFNLAETIAKQQDIQWLRDLDFWMHSIYAFTTEGHEQCQSTQDQLSPPIILVGTHRNQLDSSENERDQLIKKTFKTIEESLQGKCYRRHVVNDKFAVENGEDTGEDNKNGIVELKAKIASVAKKESYMGEEIPLRWLKFEESVKSAVKNGVDCMPIHEIKNMDGAREIPSTEPAELSAMLQFYHDLGIIMYHPNATSSLRELIILDPQWLISVFKSIITVLDKDKRRPLDKEAWERLENEGVLEDRLINHMWRNFHVNGKQMKEELLDLMEKYDLLVKQRQPTNADACPPCYYVPSRLHIESDSTLEERPGCTVFFVDFVSFLPAGIFYRLMARAVEWSQQQGDAEQPPVLSRTKSSFVADDYHQFELCRTGNMIMVTIVPEVLVGERSRDNADPRTTTQVKSFLESALSNLKTTWAPRIQYRFVFKCPCAKGDEHYLDLNKCLDVTSANIQCCKKKRIAKKVIREKFLNTQKPTERELAKDQYEMCHDPRGLCCIINNMDFSIARDKGAIMLDRRGSEKDAGALKTTFSRLQFDVDVKNNLTASEMVRYLQNQANKHDDIQVDCFVCCILTHGGGQGKLYGVNGEALDILDATSIFKGLQCPGLTGKPKLFFIQACRGSNEQPGACHVETDTLSSDVLQQESMLPNEADFLLGYATVSGFVSYRSRTQGSWYIQTLTDMINQHSSSLELHHILLRVNDEVGKKETGSEKSKQIPAPLYTLRKRLYLM